MFQFGILQIVLYLAVLLVLLKPVGLYIFNVYSKNFCGLDRIFSPLERLLYRIACIDAEREMNWKQYLFSMLIFNGFGFLFVYLILRLQGYLPLNPQHFSNISPMIAFNTAVSFVTNTNWQAYAGESSMSYFSQLFALTTQNFLSAATGMSLFVAFVRGLVKKESQHLGNFWVDLVRGILYILLPLSILLAIVLCSQGVIQNIKPYQTAHVLQSSTQVIPMGPAASQVAIKQLGTNGGGFFNANSAHPFENPTPISNFFELLAILLIPSALCYTFGVMVNDKRQGYAIFSAMMIIFIPFVFLQVMVEQQGNPAFSPSMIDQRYLPKLQSGGNMEGKEMRFGIVNSALWATATTAASNGSVNASLDSFTPIGGLISLWIMHLGEAVFGGVGSGLYSMLIMVIITVFVAGLMIGRTPAYLGKKIEPYEMKMAAVSVLIMPMIVLIFTAIASVSNMGVNAMGNPGAHGFTEILYAFTSMGNNNGSAFAGLNASSPFFAVGGGIVMLIGRYWIAIPVLAIAGSLARKKIIPRSVGTLSTDTPLFVVLLVSIMSILGALSFLPALALGPIVEQLSLWSHYAGS